MMLLSSCVVYLCICSGAVDLFFYLDMWYDVVELVPNTPLPLPVLLPVPWQAHRPPVCSCAFPKLYNLHNSIFTCFVHLHICVLDILLFVYLHIFVKMSVFSDLICFHICACWGLRAVAFLYLYFFIQLYLNIFIHIQTNVNVTRLFAYLHICACCIVFLYTNIFE